MLKHRMLGYAVIMVLSAPAATAAMAAAPGVLAIVQMNEASYGGSIEQAYYYRGHYYPHRYRGRYYRYRYRGMYFNHRYYRHGRWHYY
jgi:hypothetical protein